jgi:hypothetical protein
MGPSSGSIMIVLLKSFEFSNMDPHLVATRPCYKVMPKLECKDYNTDLLKILRVYEKFVLKL